MLTEQAVWHACSVSKFFLDTHHDLLEALDSTQKAEEGGFVMLRAVKESFITLRGISAALIQVRCTPSL